MLTEFYTVEFKSYADIFEDIIKMSTNFENKFLTD